MPHDKRCLPIAVVAGLLVLGCRSGPAPGSPAAPLAYVGRESCGGCHPRELAAWSGSHHDLAMREPAQHSVLGRFDGSALAYAGTRTTFFRRDDAYVVRADGPDGSLADFRVAYTFGVDPLQQYLVETESGRLQALSIAWDSRSAAAGGQRWFHLYPDRKIVAGHGLHWTGPFQNWNHSCAACHSTGLVKGYDASTGRFRTRWAELDVSCEACHGRGSRHVAWARSPAATGGTAGVADAGLERDLRDADGGTWVMDPDRGIARRSVPRRSRAEVEACAPCHARSSPLRDALSGAFLDSNRPALLESPLYYPDGQIEDEVYEWGSFLQSAMYRAGVTCTDCHDPHQASVDRGGTAVCTRCHLPSKFDTRAHHHHEPGSPAARCVSCHMPARTYMVVDVRRDHGFRVPRPDLTATIGVPNPCTGCHADRTASWAEQAIHRWTGKAPPPHFGEILAAGRREDLGSDARLLALGADPAMPAIVRATALATLSGPMPPAAMTTLGALSAEADPVLRFGATRALRAIPPEARDSIASRLLDDPTLAVRLEAFTSMIEVPSDRWSEGTRRSMARVETEYLGVQRRDADRAEAHLNLGNLHAIRGELDAAEEEYREALRLAPWGAETYVNLSDLLRRTHRDAEGERLLRRGLATVEEHRAVLHHALGLLLVRLGRGEQAIAELRAAVEDDPDSARFAYVLAVALQDAGRVDAARDVLEAARQRHSGNREILAALGERSPGR